MSVLDSYIPEKVIEVINTYGRSAVWDIAPRTYSASTLDASPPIDPGGPPTTFPIKVTPPWPYDVRLVDNDLIRRGDAEVVLAGQNLDFTPDTGHWVTIDGKTWQVITLTPIYCGELIAAYQAQLRRLG